MFLGLTPLGVVHTAISLVAIAAGVSALLSYKVLSPRNRAGRLYLVATFLTAATGLGIFRHGGFGPPHVLSLLTLLALGAGAAASLSTVFGTWSRQVEAVCYSTTILFHMIPGFTESLTRLPLGNPVLPNAEAPQFGPIYGTLFVLFAIGLGLQLRWLRSQPVEPA
jgi:uncharacterized membrane protein